MNLAEQLANQTSSKEIYPDYDNVEPKTEQLFVHGTSEFSGYCNGTLKTPSDVLHIEPIKDEKTIYDGRADGEQYTEEVFIKVENSVFQEDNPVMTSVSHDDTIIKEEKPNIVIKSDCGTCDSNSLICHDSEALMETDKYKNSSEENGAPRYVKEEEISIEESYVEKNEALEGNLLFKLYRNLHTYTRVRQ